MPVDPARQWANQLRRGALVQNKLQGAPRRESRRANERLAKDGLLKRLVRRRFDTQGGSQGRFWASLAPSTRKQRARLGFPPTTPKLVRTGTLRRHASEKARQKATSTSLRITMAPGSGPKYSGRKRAPALSRYAPALNAARPFFGPFKGKELAKIEEARGKFLAKRYANIVDGKS